MKSKFVFIMFLQILYCCSPKDDKSISEVFLDGSKISVFSLNTLKSDTATIYLSSLVEYCDFVQLEFTEEALFKPWMTTITEKYIGIMQERASYKLFDRSGKFLCTVGSVGQGPGEYLILYDDLIDDENDLIYISHFIGNKIFIYNTSGKFIKELISPQTLIYPRLFMSDNLLTIMQMPFTEDNVMALQFDVTSGNVLNELSPPMHLIARNNSEALYNSRNVQAIFDIIHTCSDTLYHFEMKNNTIIPIFTMKYKPSEEIYLRYCQLNKDLIMIFLFERGVITSDLKNRKSSWVKVINDYYGNIEIKVSLSHFRNGYFVHNIQPEQLMEDITHRLTEQNCTEKDKQILLKTLSTLKEDANNVVFIGKLKNEVKTKLW